jgi:hypothetical protein
MSHNLRFKTKHNAAVYHCISRTINGENLFDDASKEMLRKHLHQAAEFSGVKVLTYAFMSNHFHVLVKVPEQGVVSDEELVRRYKILHPNPSKWVTRQVVILETTLKENGPDAQKLRDQLLARMGDLSEFMKTFKQRFSIWYNCDHDRFGPVWSERFTSTIIEGNRHFGLQMVAAYVDLNPVRAGVVKDPKDYRWSGYGEAEAIGGKMVEGLRLAMEEGDSLSDKEILASYRMALFGKGAAPKRGDSKAARIRTKDYDKVLKSAGELTPDERLNLRVSLFTHGGVIGSKPFVSELLGDYRKKTKKRSRLKPRPFSNKQGDSWNDLFAMRSRQ